MCFSWLLLLPPPAVETTLGTHMNIQKNENMSYLNAANRYASICEYLMALLY